MRRSAGVAQIFGQPFEQARDILRIDEGMHREADPAAVRPQQNIILRRQRHQLLGFGVGEADVAGAGLRGLGRCHVEAEIDELVPQRTAERPRVIGDPIDADIGEIFERCA